MFLATREIRHSRFRYILIAAIMALISWLVFIIGGLANGLSHDNAGAFVNMDADYLVFREDSGYSPRRSVLEANMVEAMGQVDGIESATPLGLVSLSANSPDAQEVIDITVFGIDPNGFLMPEITEGQALPDHATNEVVVDESIKENGVQLGDTLDVLFSDQTLKVVGFTKNQKYSHMPVVFGDVALWQALRFSNPASREGVENPVNAVVLQGDKDAIERIEQEFDGIEIATLDEAVHQVPGFSAEMETTQMIQVFLFFITALIMTVFFYVITMQKTNQLGILKALGAKTSILARSLLIQVFLTSLVGIVVGALLTMGVTAVLPSDAPFRLNAAVLIFAGVVMLGVAVAGSYLSLRRIVAVDPMIALGRSD